jgi:hypothetical protein
MGSNLQHLGSDERGGVDQDNERGGVQEELSEEEWRRDM